MPKIACAEGAQLFTASECFLSAVQLEADMRKLEYHSTTVKQQNTMTPQLHDI